MHKRMSRISAVLATGILFGGYIQPLTTINAKDISQKQNITNIKQAQSTFSVSSNKLTCGYDRIYRDTTSSTWINPKPQQPANQTLTITFNASQGDAYTFNLGDGISENIASVSGDANEGQNTVTLNVPGTTASGVYFLVGQIGSATPKTEKITIDNNLALDATFAATPNGNAQYLNDLTINNYEAKNSSDNSGVLSTPVEMTATLKKSSVVSAVDVFSSNISTQGPTEISLYSVDDQGQEKLLQTFSDLKWTKYVTQSGENQSLGAPRVKATLQLNEPITTSKLKIKVTKGNANNYKKIVFDEVMILGHEVNDNYTLSLGQSVGAENQVNKISITGKAVGDLANEAVTVKLVKDGKTYASGESAFKNGQLDYELVTSDKLAAGSYQVIITSADGKINKTFDYSVKAAYTYESNISKKLNVFKDVSTETDTTKLTKLDDDDFNTSESVSSFRLYSADKSPAQSFLVRAIKIYAPEDSFSTATIKAATNARFDQAMVDLKSFNNLEWQKDDNGSYVELYVPDNYLSYGYQVSLGNKAIDVKEVVTEGTYFAQNLLNDAEVTYDGQTLDAGNMTDNSISNDVTFNNPGSTEHTIDFTLKDGNIYELKNLMFAANFPGSQGIKTIQVGYFQDGKWIYLDKQTPTYKSSDQRRELYNLDLPNIQTNKLRLKVTFNTQWSKGIISEINVIGEKTKSAQAIANLLNHVDKVTASSTKLTTNWLKDIDANYADEYDVSVAQTSDPAVIGMDGTINHQSTDKDVTIQYQVTDKKAKAKYLSPTFSVTVPAALEKGYSDVALPIDKTTAYKNPAMGWVAYIEGFECSVHERYQDGKDDAITNPNAQNKGLCLELDTPADVDEYWKQMDALIAQGMPVNILYIREPWSWFEPSKGEYTWKDPDSIFGKLVQGARQRNIQLAFRILTCSSACAQQAVPQYVMDDGAEFTTKSYDYVKNVKEPYINDPIFQKDFQTFLTEFGKAFNNEQTAFVDANGLGEWGEQNANVFIKNGNGNGDLNTTVNKMMDFYEAAFPNVLLGGQQGSSQGGSEITKSFDISGRNFVVRRDAFGSDKYLRNTGNAASIKQYRSQGIPVFAENCYHHFQSRDFRWSSVIDYPANGGGPDEYGGDDPFITMQDMMDKVVYDALDLGANTLDLRTLEDCKLWMQDGQKYLQEFTQKGGYRIAVTEAKFNNSVKENGDVKLTTTWQNNGVGILPNKNKRWDNKMKIAYALIDQNGKIVKQQVIASDQINPGDFEKGTDYKNEVTFSTKDVKPGNYRLATAILNSRDNNNVGVQLANATEKTNDGWVTLGDVTVQGQKVDVSQSQTGGSGTISFDKELIVGQPVTMTITPNAGYRVKTVKINGQVVALSGNSYSFAALPAALNIEVEYEKIADTTQPDAGDGQNPDTNQPQEDLPKDSATSIDTTYTKVDLTKDTKKQKMPQTGEQTNSMLSLLGIITVVGTLGAWFKFKK